jgi:hypothetical protein
MSYTNPHKTVYMGLRRRKLAAGSAFRYGVRCVSFGKVQWGNTVYFLPEYYFMALLRESCHLKINFASDACGY